MIQSDRPYMNYLLDIIGDIENSLKKTSKDKFKENKDKREANIRRLEIISEAIKNISKELKNKYPDIKWDSLARIRDNLRNHYFGIDFNAVWKLIIEDIPTLKEQINKIKKEEYGKQKKKIK